jgi:predicted component of type VI protein secretion system
MQARFATFAFDDGTRELRRGDRLVHLSPKAFDLLGLLLAQRPRATMDCSLVWSDQRARLKPGESILGRDPEADILIEAVGVSRRHAAIVVGADVVTLRDLASKNGTFVDGTRVTTAVHLHDNTEIRLGAVRLRFRQAGLAGPTQTVDGSDDARRTS